MNTPKQIGVGDTFGCWEVTGYVGRKPGKCGVFWSCRCSCGRVRDAGQAALISGRVVRCVCARIKVAAMASKTHGLSNTQEYIVWKGMIQRCEDKKHISAKSYVGISVCDRWRHDFGAFYLDMGKRPTPKHMIERTDNLKGYEPGNCKWATRLEQNRNKRNNIIVEMDGQKLCIAAWCEKLGISASVVNTRVHRGWSYEKSLKTPLLRKRKKKVD